MEDTPRTGAEEFHICMSPTGEGKDLFIVDGDFARQLERELTEANSRLHNVKSSLISLLVASCSCLTKSSKVEHHADYCLYKKLIKIIKEIEEPIKGRL